MTTPTQQINLIRSILGHAQNRDPNTVIQEIITITQGHDITNIRTRKEE